MEKFCIRIPKLNKIRISLSRESLAQSALFMFLCTEAFRQIIEKIIGNSTLSNYIAIFIIYIPVVFLLINGEFKAFDFLVLWFIIVAAFGVSYILYPQNSYYFTRPTYGVLYRVLRMDRPIYGYLFIRLCYDKKRIMKTVESASVFLLIYYVIVLLNALKIGYWMEYNGAGVLVKRTYSLVYGYNCLLPTLVFLYRALSSGKIRYYIMAAIGFFCIVMGGSRGALLCIVIFLFFYLLRNWKEWSRNYVFLFLCVVGIICCLFIVCEGNAVLINFLKVNGIESRTIEKLLEGSLSDDNGRRIIWNMAIKMIKEGGFFGYGLYGDRPVISSFHYAGYCHNLFLELLVNVGVPIGSCLIGVVVIYSIKMLIFCPDDDWRNLFLIFFACSCELILSMSLWYVNYFWLAFGIGISYRKEYKKLRRTEK